nr:hypothetical protein [Tanacetum cinerariifolium]
MFRRNPPLSKDVMSPPSPPNLLLLPAFIVHGLFRIRGIMYLFNASRFVPPSVTGSTPPDHIDEIADTRLAEFVVGTHAISHSQNSDEDKQNFDNEYVAFTGHEVAYISLILCPAPKKLMHTSDDFTLDQIQKHLRIEEETRIHEKNLNGASSSKVNYVDSGKNNKGNDKKRKGHIKRYCKNPKKKNQNSNKDESATAVEQVDTTEFTTIVSKMNIEMMQELHMASVITTDDWWYDFGATTHVCNNKDLFKTYKKTEDGHEVMMGHNHTLKVIGSGNMEIQFTSGKKLTLMNVLHVPNIRNNLVSGFKLCKSRVKAVIESEKVILSKANVFVGKAYACDGHINYRTMKDMLKQGIISYNGEHKDKCEICVQAKMKRKHFLKVDRQSELVHSDICELNGQLTRGENRTTPYTPQQNGVAERKNKVLQDMINAIITAKKLKVSPYEVWKGRKPNISYFRVWGCLAYYKVPLPNTSKLGPRGLKSIFVGYAKDSKSYRCLDFNSNVIVESRDVDFFENKFRYDSTSTNEIVTQIPQDISGPNSNSNNKRNMAESSSAPRRSERARKERNLDPDFIDSQAIIFLVEGDNENNVINKIPVLLNVEDAPKTYKEAITSRNSTFWKEAIDDEMDSLMKDMNGVETCLGIKEANTPYESSCKLVENDGRAVAQIEYASAIGHSDVSWITGSSDSKSITGWIFTLDGGATGSDEVIKSSVEDLVTIPNQIEDFSESNNEVSSIDDDSFSIDNIDYVEASPPDSELVSSEGFTYVDIRSGAAPTKVVDLVAVSGDGDDSDGDGT